MKKGDEPAVAARIEADPLAARIQKKLMTEADRILGARTCRHEIPDGKRLLHESRLALHNILHCAWAWRMGGDERHRLRVVAELEAACTMKDWNTSHFLDTAEMAAAVAVGYDWLHATLTPAQRAMCERALIEKALLPARAIYQKGGWWTNASNNWAQVCGSGIALGAAAIAGHDEGLAEELFVAGLELVERCSRFYNPDGMYPEGPGYWHYGTNYHVILLAACEPLGRSSRNEPLLQKAGHAIMHLTGPTRMGFNFADAGARSEQPSAAQAWIARHFSDQLQARHVRDLFARALDDRAGRFSHDRLGPLALLWLPEDPGKLALPSAAVFGGQQSVALFRTAWSPDAAWLGIKGGTPAASHGQMDVGAFVFDAHGERWFHDLGADDYNLPAYFGNKRWDYFRLQNRSHNTLEIADRLQMPKSAPCPIIDSSTAGKTFAATFDISTAYQNSAKRVLRRAEMDTASGTVRLRDHITTPAGGVVWRAFTKAEPRIEGDKVILGQRGKSITIRRLSADGVWSVRAATPPTREENQNSGFRALCLEVPAADEVSIDIEIRP